MMLGAAARIPSAGGLSLLRTLVAPLRSMVDERFHGAEAKILFGGNAVHLVLLVAIGILVYELLAEDPPPA